MEVPEWYDLWVAEYLDAFGITAPTSTTWAATMTRNWWPAFAGAGYRREDFAGVVGRVILYTPTPRWLNEHLDAIKRAVSEHRQANRPAAESPTFEAPVCPDCDNTAWVIVPHPADVKDGEWKPERLNGRGDPVFRTASVVCTGCGPGLKLRNAAYEDEKLKKKPPMTIDRYERVNPAWREHLAERKAAEKAMREADDVSRSAEAVDFAALAKRLVERHKNMPAS